MGLTKQYLRYEPEAVFSVIGSQKSKIVYLDIKGSAGKYCAVGACENVLIWDLKKGEKVLLLQGQKHEVTVISKSPDKQHLAVGYNDGAIRVFELETGECVVNFSGHKSTVTALNYDEDGVRLVSGSKDTDVIVWDIVNESGLFRLKGHKGSVTQARFLKKRNILITSSKDTFIKFWDLDTQHCFKTLVGHRTEIYDFVLASEETLMVTGCADSELRLWRIKYLDSQVPSDEIPSKKLKTDDGDEEDDESEVILQCSKVGSIMRQGRDRLVTMATDKEARVLGCHGNDSKLEVFIIPTEEELKKHLAKRQKKAKRKLKGTGEVAGEVNVEIRVEDELQRFSTINTSGKIVAFDCFVDKQNQAKMLTLLSNNVIEAHSLDVKTKNSEATVSSKLLLPGHRSDVRTVCFSSDNTAILSASGELVKIWNRSTQHCICSMKCDYALSSLFAPGDRHIILGTKTGKIQIFDIAAGTLLEDVDAHSGPVWSLCMAPDKRGIVSGSADKEVKFWDFELITDEKYSATSKRLTLDHNRTLQMSEDVLCVKFSPDHRLLAVSLLDNTVKVFFADTLKFFLSLYGHKLPVLCMDISSDSSLLVTGSADRNVKLWGLDFGDCHKSIFAHDDSIMCLQFVPKTHMFFTGGKDNKIKEWDGDKFEQIQTLEGHHAEVWCLAISSNGNHVVTGSHDKSLRLWGKTQEPLILEEEREVEREREYEETVGKGEETVVPGESTGTSEVSMAGKKTIETVKAAEKLMEAIELYKEETSKLQEHEAEVKSSRKLLPAPSLHPMFMAYGVSTPLKYMLEVIKKIKSSELEESLLVLPFSYVTDLLKILSQFIENSWEVELSCRCLFFLMRVHHGQISSTQELLPVIDKLRTNTTQRVHQKRDVIGFNMAGLQFLKKMIEEKEEVAFFADATDRFKTKKKKEKKKAILAMKV